MSFEKRFKMRPEGFVSKNRNFVEMIPLNMELQMVCDARMQIS